MRRNLIFTFFLILTMISGCLGGGFHVVNEDYRPIYMCSGDNVWAEVELNKKISRIRIFDNTGTRLFADSDRKIVELTVENIQPEQLQLETRLKQKIRFWPDKTIKKYSDFELFDNPRWSSGIESINYDGGHHVDEYYEVYTEENCYCDFDEEDNCIDVCEDIEECYYEYDIYFILESLEFVLPDYQYSSKINVDGVKNNNDFPIIVNAAGVNYNVAPGLEISFPKVSYGAVSISAIVDPPDERLCGYDQIPACCPGADICFGGGGKPTYPNAANCFEDYEASVQLHLECEVPEE